MYDTKYDLYISDLLYDASYLQHYGIKGQQWGKRNGPPYPLSEKKHDKVVESATDISSATPSRMIDDRTSPTAYTPAEAKRKVATPEMKKFLSSKHDGDRDFFDNRYTKDGDNYSYKQYSYDYKNKKWLTRTAQTTSNETKALNELSKNIDKIMSSARNEALNYLIKEESEWFDDTDTKTDIKNLFLSSGKDLNGNFKGNIATNLRLSIIGDNGKFIEPLKIVFNSNRISSVLGGYGIYVEYDMNEKKINTHNIRLY